MAEESKRGGGLFMMGLAIFGAVGAAVGIWAFARDEITAYFDPDQAAAKVEDVVEATDELRDGLAEDLTAVIVETVPSRDEIREIVRDTLDDVSEDAAVEGRVIGAEQTFEFVDVTSGLLESTDPEKAEVRVALTERQPSSAAAELVRLAKLQTEDLSVSRDTAAETWREAGAILYALDPAQAAEAYRNAAELSTTNTDFSALAQQIEAELERRQSEDAPGARLIPQTYVGPVRDFAEAFEFGDLGITPVGCSGEATTLTCELSVSYSGPEKQINIDVVRLIDDWAREYTPSEILFSERRSRNSDEITNSIPPGEHSLKLIFQGVVAGSNYGLEFVVDRSSVFRWRNVPNEGLETELREAWGGPIGVASFLPLNEELSFNPYGLRMTGCERFGRRLSCFGQIGYEGPEHQFEFRNITLTSAQEQVHRPSSMRVSTRSVSNTDDISVTMPTGLFDFEIDFWSIPFFETYTLGGFIGRDTEFEFSPFTLGENDASFEERLAFFYDWPPRVDMGGNIRSGDFKFFPNSCVRVEFTATCEIEFIYVGAPRQIEFDLVSLVDSENNYYRPSELTIGERRSRNSDGVTTTLLAGRHSLRVVFESVPKSRLYELQAEIGGRDYLTVSNITLPSSDGSLGIPTDIQHYDVGTTASVGDIELEVQGCTRRSEALRCYIQVDYFGPARQVEFRDIVASQAEEGPIRPTQIMSAGRRVTNTDDFSVLMVSGSYSLIIEFVGLTATKDVRASINVDRRSDLSWAISLTE